MNRLLSYLGLDRTSLLSGLVFIVTAGPVLLVTTQAQPAADAPLPQWTLYWLVLLAAGAVFLWGLLNVALVVIRSGRLARTVLPRVRLVVLPEGDEGTAREEDGRANPLVVALRQRVADRDRQIEDLRERINARPAQGALQQAVRELSEARDNAQRIAGQNAELIAKFRAALDTTITWLYRRQHWEKLSREGRTSDPAPGPAWAHEKYRELGFRDLPYSPPYAVPPEPGFDGPASADSFPNPFGGGSEEVSARGQYYDWDGSPLARGPEGIDPPDEDRPPNAWDLPPGVWENHAAKGFCEKLRAVHEEGGSLLATLHALPTDPSPHDHQLVEQAVETFFENLRLLESTYYGEPVPREPAGHALPPQWRRDLVRLVTPAVHWLGEQRGQFRCQ